MSETAWTLHTGDCREVLRTLEAGSVDAVICDPPYAEIDRAYGRLSETAWATLMHDIVSHLRRTLKPSGSAMLVLQPNSEHVGKMRPWVWDFLSWCCREWNVIQDAYWWNHTAFPTVGASRRYGLLRPSLKYCIWLGAPDCYRDQAAVLWEASATTKGWSLEDRLMRYNPSGAHNRPGRACATALERGGVTPFNVLPLANTDSMHSAGALGHGAGTPLALCRWWVRYLCPPGGTVLDPFSGSASTGVAALREGRRYVGIEQDARYADASRQRLAVEQLALGR